MRSTRRQLFQLQRRYNILSWLPGELVALVEQWALGGMVRSLLIRVWMAMWYAPADVGFIIANTPRPLSAESLQHVLIVLCSFTDRLINGG